MSQALVSLWDEETTRRQKRIERVSELGRMIPEMPEAKLTQQIESLLISLRIFTVNYKELYQALHVLTIDESGTGLLFEQNRSQLDIFLKEVTRLLHNFVAAAQSLVEHTRRLHRKLYEPENLFSDYQKRVEDDFANDPLSRFVQELRNYVLHYDVPAPMFSWRYQAGSAQSGPTMTRAALLPVTQLLEFDGWRSKAKEFMKGKETIDILEVVRDYASKVFAFHEWFQANQHQIHAEEFKRLRERKREGFLLWLEMAVDTAFEGNPAFFHSQLTGDEWQEIMGLVRNPTALAYRVVALLGKRHALPGSLKRHIITLCRTPGFALPPQLAWP